MAPTLPCPASESISAVTATWARGWSPEAPHTLRADSEWLIRNGATIPHFEAWLAVRGLRTLGLRMTRHSANAAAIAAYLTNVAAVARVHHPSLAEHPQHQLAQRLYPRGTGGIVAFDLVGDRREVETFLRGLR